MLKRIVFSLLAMLLVLITLLAVLLASFDPNRLKPKLEQQLQQHTGLSLQLSGELQWQLLPTLAVTVGETELHTPVAFDQSTLLARFESIALGVSWRSLLTRNIEISALQIDKLLLRLVTDQSGQSNWQLAATQQTSAPPTASDPPDSSKTMPFKLASLAVSDAEVLLVDLASDTRQALLLDTLQAAQLNLQGSAFPLSAELQLQDATLQPLAIAIETQASINTESQTLELQQLDAKLDGSQLSGALSINFADKLSLTAQLDIDAVSLDDYLSTRSPEGTTSEEAKNKPAQQLPEEAALPLAWMHLFNGQLKLQIGKMTANAVPITALSLQAGLENSVLTVHHFSASAYGGELELQASVDHRQSQARLELTQRLQDVAIEQLLASLGTSVDFRGKAQLHSSLRANTTSLAQLKRSLQGQTQVRLLEAFYGDDNIERRVCQAIALIRNETPTANWPQGTHLSAIEADIDWREGIAHFSHLKAATDSFRMEGEGRYSLLDGHYDTRLGATLAASDPEVLTAMDPACIINPRYRDIAWPLRCQGSAAQHSCRVDNSRLDKLIKQRLTDQAKSKLEEKVQSEVHDKLKEKLGEELGDSIGDALQDALQGLFK